ncbi:MAG: ferritin family protein [candidate division Zixibacteria bacterium]|nr:ferritin family protein [candidate division Zixibacteria bacterium]
MTNSKKKLADGLLKAIKAEKYGHSFYLMAAKSTEDKKGQEVFKTLAREELDHMQFLKDQYRSIVDTGQPNKALKLGTRTLLSEASPIFSEKLRSRIKDANFEMTSLSIGIQLEHDAMIYYREQSETVDDSIMKDFYAKLADWEAGHYQALLKQQDELKEDFWSSSGFSPF